MSTPLRGIFKGTKRSCPSSSPISSPSQPAGLEDVMREVNASSLVPDCVKAALNTLIKELSEVKLERDQLRQENLILRQKLGLAPDVPLSSTEPIVDQPVNTIRSDVIDCQESERPGVPELKECSIRRKLFYDNNSVLNILEYLDVDCLPVAVYRLGRPTMGRDRLLKVVLPSLAVSRASRLRFFPGRGVFLRESRTNAERKRLREERMMHPNSSSLPHSFAADLMHLEFCVRLVVVYRPPSTSSYINELLAKAISDLTAVTFPVVVVGDFNLPEVNGPIGMFPRTLHTLCPILLLVTDSRSTLRSPLESSIGDSDHLSITFDITGVELPCVPVFKRLFSKCDYSLVTNYLFSVLWVDSFESVSTVDEKYLMFLTILKHAIQLYVPWAYVFPSRPNLPSYLQNMMDHKECLLQYAKRSGDWTEFRAFSQKFSEKLCKYNKSMEKKIVEAKDKQRFFKYLGSKLRERPNFYGLKVNGRILLNDHDKANAFAREFSTAYHQDNNKLPHFAPTVGSKMQTFPYFDPNDIFHFLMRWPSSYSITPDEIPFAFVKNVAHAIAFPLSYLFNQSI
ncbi:hypothetical protein OSTOST_25314, partial [Ostertagia ostertagi]